MPKRAIFGGLLAILCCLLTVSGYAASRQEALLITASKVIDELRQTPDQNIPNWLLDRAYAVAVVPNVVKVGLILGGRRGSGALLVRREDGSWSNPIFVNLTGGSFGFQWGVQSTDVVLVFTSRAGIEGITGGKVTLGADASVAAGPVGRQTAVATDIGLTAQVYSYSRNKGLFIGVALDGSAITIDNSANEFFYSKNDIYPSDIIAAPSTDDPSARQFVAAIHSSSSASHLPATPAPTSPPPPPAASTQPATTTPTREQPGSLTTYPMEDSSPGAEPPQ